MEHAVARSEGSISAPVDPERPFYPLANEFPLLAGAEFDALVEAIQRNGQRDPITMLDGLVLDGRNRWRACRQLGIDPKVEYYDGSRETIDLIEFVLDRNDRRRHLPEAERIEIAGRLYAAERASHGGARRGEDFKSSGELLKVTEQNQHVTKITGRFEGNKARGRIAEKMGVSGTSIHRSAKVDRDGVPQVRDAIRTSSLSLHAADALVELSKDEQIAALSAGGEALTAAITRGREIQNERGKKVGAGRKPGKAAGPTARGSRGAKARVVAAAAAAVGADAGMIAEKLKKLSEGADHRSGHLARGLQMVVEVSRELPEEEAALVMTRSYRDFEERLLAPALAYLTKLSACIGQSADGAENPKRNN